MDRSPDATATDTVPDERGRFGAYGGRYAPEVLIPALDELAAAWAILRDAPRFPRRTGHARARFRRPADAPHARARGFPASSATTCGSSARTSRIPGAHKINNALGQALLAKRLGKERIIAETGAGQHGVATATACALLGLPCVVYMGEEDTHGARPRTSRG